MLRCTSKRMFLLGWSHRYKYFTVVIWLTVMKYSFPIWPWIFSPLRRLLSFLSHWQNLCRSSLTDKTFVFPLSLTRLLSFLSHWQDFCRSSLTDKIFVFPLSLTRPLSYLTMISRCVSYKEQEQLTFLWWSPFSSSFQFSVLCFLFCLPSICELCPMLHVDLDFPFFIVRWTPFCLPQRLSYSVYLFWINFILY